jgi:hypothetical protein
MSSASLHELLRDLFRLTVAVEPVRKSAAYNRVLAQVLALHDELRVDAAAPAVEPAPVAPAEPAPAEAAPVEPAVAAPTAVTPEATRQRWQLLAAWAAECEGSLRMFAHSYPEPVFVNACANMESVMHAVAASFRGKGDGSAPLNEDALAAAMRDAGEPVPAAAPGPEASPIVLVVEPATPGDAAESGEAEADDHDAEVEADVEVVPHGESAAQAAAVTSTFTASAEPVATSGAVAYHIAPDDASRVPSPPAIEEAAAEDETATEEGDAAAEAAADDETPVTEEGDAAAEAAADDETPAIEEAAEVAADDETPAIEEAAEGTAEDEAPAEEEAEEVQEVKIGRKTYWLLPSSQTVYAQTAEGDLGDEVGTLVNGKLVRAAAA